MIYMKINNIIRGLLFIAMVSLSTVEAHAQNYNYVISSTFEPLSMEEMILSAKAEAYRQNVAKQRFEEYKAKAYECYNKQDYNGFITYSNYALDTGWYNSKLYYDRGAIFEHFHDYKNAKKEYKKALRKGYYPAQNALKQCKVNQKVWKKSH